MTLPWILILSTFVELKTKEHGYAKGVAEVCKYALKFSDLSMENTFHAFLTLKGKRLTGSFGSMHGLKIDKAVPDEISKDDLPYMEMIYRFVFGEKNPVRLIFNKTRRATSYERGGVRRRKRPTDTTDRVTERLAIRQKVEVRTVAVRGPAVRTDRNETL